MKPGETTLRHLVKPIQDLLDDPKVVEVVIQREREVGFERDGKWGWRTVDEFDYRRLDALGLLAGNLMSKKFDPANPICLTTLPGGERLSTNWTAFWSWLGSPMFWSTCLRVPETLVRLWMICNSVWVTAPAAFWS
jgi:Flp pilus assembly CpaF family ATPase